MSAIWGIVDLSVAQSEAQRKIVQGTCGKRLCGCGRPIGRAAWTGYRKKGRQPIIWPAGYRMSQGKLWKKDSLMKERESAEVCSWRM